MSKYIEKIKMAQKLIIENLDKGLTWPDIAKQCAISGYHFHRIFSSQTGETPRDFLVRKRLEKAISRLAYSREEIILADLALECGYSSQANFSKAFKKYFGITPGEVLNEKTPKNSKIGNIKSKYGKEFHLESLYPNEELKDDLHIKEVKMKATIKDFPTRKVAYMSSKNGYVSESIMQTWQSLMQTASTMGKDLETMEKYGIGHDNPQVTPLEKCRYDACIEVNENEVIPNHLESTVFPNGKYACFHYKGSKEKLLQFYLEIYKSWFSESGNEPGDFPLIERYLVVDKDNPEADIELETQFLLK
ncbi:GyrI-like domain-containing protein [Halobacteriovorax sp. GB3]|uniref:AraC family transcriptional regulator n=1 Tax=Halobacteriovorax sp. GB3 TaxID=2719615 RepID=UPI00236027DF|nr:GyrI-like domain-containing protein [Halobacteriovorax sp. GB3]MDD0854009.1 GyrI-like domain-containing protein [Halobacteriovorax sp. GB3]